MITGSVAKRLTHCAIQADKTCYKLFRSEQIAEAFNLIGNYEAKYANLVLTVLLTT